MAHAVHKFRGPTSTGLGGVERSRFPLSVLIYMMMTSGHPCKMHRIPVAMDIGYSLFTKNVLSCYGAIPAYKSTNFGGCRVSRSGEKLS